MNLPSLLLPLILAATASTAWAASSSDAYIPDASAAEPAAPSAEARTHREFGLQLTYGAPGLGMWMAGGEVTSFRGQRWQLSLSYAQGGATTTVVAADESGNNVTTALAHLNMQGKQLTVGSRYFLGNSFFVGAESGLRSYNVNYNFYVYNDASSESESGEGRVLVDSLIGKVKLGNQWLFDSGLIITAEWIGYEQPLLSNHGSSYTTSLKSQDSGQAIADANAAVIQLLEKRGNVSSQLGIGWAF